MWEACGKVLARGGHKPYILLDGRTGLCGGGTPPYWPALPWEAVLTENTSLVFQFQFLFLTLLMFVYLVIISPVTRDIYRANCAEILCVWLRAHLYTQSCN